MRLAEAAPKPRKKRIKASSRRVSMADVARLCGVSSATVSYVLTGRADEMRIPPGTREKILAVCDKLNYRRNYLASSLASGSTGTVGVVFANARGEFMNGLLTGIREAMGERNIESIVALSGDDLGKESRHLEMLDHRRADAIIAFPVWTPSGFGHWARFLSDPARPVVFVDMAPPGAGIHFVGIDDQRAGREAARLAIRQRATESVILQERSPAPTAADRVAGFREEWRAEGLPEPILLEVGDTAPCIDFMRSPSEGRRVFFSPVAGHLLSPLSTAHRAGKLDARHLLLSVGVAEESTFLPNEWWMLPQHPVTIGREAASMVLALRAGGASTAKRLVPSNWVCNSSTEWLSRYGAASSVQIPAPH
jgi:LacI family transcriptional regulator, kdg operon repressor